MRAEQICRTGRNPSHVPPVAVSDTREGASNTVEDAFNTQGSVSHTMSDTVGSVSNTEPETVKFVTNTVSDTIWSVTRECV